MAILCSTCSTIDFDLLWVPTAGQLRRLSDGLDAPDQYPYKGRPEGLPTTWDLGCMKRVRESAGACELCRAILQLFQDVRDAGRPLTLDMTCKVHINSFRGSFLPLSAARTPVTSPRQAALSNRPDPRFYFKSLTVYWPPAESTTHYGDMTYATNWLHACDARQSTDPTTLFKDDSIPDDGLILCGRTVSPTIQPDMLRAWMQQCTSNHGASCGTESLARFVDDLFPVGARED